MFHMLGYRFEHDTEVASESSYRDSTESLRGMITAEQVMRPRSLPRILLLDDDRSFGRLMTQAAMVKGSKVQFCRSIDDLAQLTSWDYDVIIMDYDLGSITGFELTLYLERFTTREIPVVLVSQSKLRGSKEWPETIREFVHKGLGPFSILDAAFEAHEVNTINRSIKAEVGS